MESGGRAKFECSIPPRRGAWPIGRSENQLDSAVPVGLLRLLHGRARELA